jgi:hypothetical protein
VGRFARLVGINLLVVLVLALAIELVFGSWFYGPDFGALNVGVNALRTELDSPYYPPGTEVIYRRDAYGLRGDYGDPGAITILAIGGSTTNDRAIGQGDTWTDVLEQALRAQGYDHVVANAGVDGHSSYGHIKSFELWYPNIPNLHPDYAIIYVGHNDRGVAPGDIPQADLLTSPSWSRRVGSYVANHSIFARAYKNLLGWIAARRIDVVYGEVDTDPATVTFVPMPDVDVDAAAMDLSLKAYHERLKVLNQLALDFGTTPVYVTQPVGLVREGPSGLEVVADSNAARVYREMQGYNAELLAFCREVDTICIDLAGELAFDIQDFYDAIHTTPSGSRKIGEFLASKWPDAIEPPP